MIVKNMLHVPGLFSEHQKAPFVTFRCQSSSKATHLLALNPQIEFSNPTTCSERSLSPAASPPREQNSLSKISRGRLATKLRAMTMYVCSRESRRVSRSDFGASNITHIQSSCALFEWVYFSTPWSTSAPQRSTWPRECRLYGMCGRVSAAAASAGGR
jgi:hypothetical protein